MKTRIGFVCALVVMTVCVVGCRQRHTVDGHGMNWQDQPPAVEAADIAPSLPADFKIPNESAADLPSPSETIGEVGYYERSAYEARIARLEEENARLKMELGYNR